VVAKTWKESTPGTSAGKDTVAVVVVGRHAEEVVLRLNPIETVPRRPLS
jgi:hypothetical protein